MNQFQKVAFRDFNDFYDYLPREEQVMVDILRDIVFDTIPGVEERLAYNVPFYYRRKRICYIWPSSIPWGGLKPGSGVALGFVKGRILAGDLLKGNGKDVRYLLFSKPADIDRQLISVLLSEAMELDALSG